MKVKRNCITCLWYKSEGQRQTCDALMEIQGADAETYWCHSWRNKEEKVERVVLGE